MIKQSSSGLWNLKKSNFETDNEKIFNITELAMLRVMTMMTGELDATDLLLNFSDFNFRKGPKDAVALL